jgi:hypothetical protein
MLLTSGAVEQIPAAATGRPAEPRELRSASR